ncbi:hypothetical protein RHSIM_RhsimUnG0139400 [Rhododendron simsii]|uniref:Uncharacterized protein n=1 Tax=Rhododendron simsii TaxID=118357 RepID=A0A834FUE6_RHOSS|nr:hypothetical protein RHSIM_RhsimUnG0139400 [Rhododendron simsii]
MEIATSQPKPKPGPPKPINPPRRGQNRIKIQIFGDLFKPGVSIAKQREENGGALSAASTIPHTATGYNSYGLSDGNNAAGDLCCRGGGSVVLAVVGGI